MLDQIRFFKLCVNRKVIKKVREKMTENFNTQEVHTLYNNISLQELHF